MSNRLWSNGSLFVFMVSIAYYKNKKSSQFCKKCCRRHKTQDNSRIICSQENVTFSKLNWICDFDGGDIIPIKMNKGTNKLRQNPIVFLQDSTKHVIVGHVVRDNDFVVFVRCVLHLTIRSLESFLR